jgi:hypothetical protein
LFTPKATQNASIKTTSNKSKYRVLQKSGYRFKITKPGLSSKPAENPGFWERNLPKMNSKPSLDNIVMCDKGRRGWVKVRCENCR